MALDRQVGVRKRQFGRVPYQDAVARCAQCLQQGVDLIHRHPGHGVGIESPAGQARAQGAAQLTQTRVRERDDEIR